MGLNGGGNHSEFNELGAKRENSSAAIRHNAFKENSGSCDDIPKQMRMEVDIRKPNDRHAGIALAPLPTHPNTSRNISMPRTEESSPAIYNIHPIHGAPTVMNVPRMSNRVEPIDHSAYKIVSNSAMGEELTQIGG